MKFEATLLGYQTILG